MTRQYDDDWIDGRRMSQSVVNQDYVLTETHVGTLHVEAGHFTLAGVLEGTLDVQAGASASIMGKQQGTVSVGRGATVEVTGAIEGSTSVEHGGVVIIEAGGKLAGTLANEGEVIIRGVFGGLRSGGGEFRVENGGHVKQPTMRNGIAYYEW